MLLVNYFFFPPIFTFIIQTPQDALKLAIFCVSGISISILNSALSHYRMNTKILEASAQSDATMRTVFENSPFAVLAIDAESGIIQHVNAAVEKTFGYQPTELIGQTVELLVPDHLRNLHLEHRRQYLKTPTARQMGAGRDLLGRCKDGTEFPVEVSLTPVTLDRKLTIMVHVTDISLRKAAEQKLKDSEEQLKIFIDQCPFAIAMFDQKMNYLAASQRWVTDLVHGAPHIIGRNHYEVFPEIPERWKEIHRRTLAGASEESDEDIFPREDGSIDYLRWKVSPWRDDQQKIGGIIMFSESITAQKRLEIKLREALEARDEFLSVASHELKSPITALLLQYQLRKRLMNRGDLGNLNQKTFLENMASDENQIKKLNRLVEDMLDGVRIKSGHLTIEFQKMDIGALTNTVMQRLQVEFQNAKVPLTVTECESVSGWWDPQRLDQVLTNLLTNALKYGEKSPVSVSLRRVDKSIELRVRDEGPGISKENQERIFNRFERAVKENHMSGLGLGLYITKQLVELHGGSIKVESELGRGSTFVVVLPIHEVLESKIA